MKEKITLVLVLICGLAFVSSVLPSCVMPGDIEKLEWSQANYNRQMDESLRELRDEEITKEQFEAQAKVAQEQKDRELHEVVLETKQRTEALIEAAKTGAFGTTEIVGTVSGFGLALAGLYAKTKNDAVTQVNHDRDRKYLPKQEA